MIAQLVVRSMRSRQPAMRGQFGAVIMDGGGDHFPVGFGQRRWLDPLSMAAMVMPPILLAAGSI